MLLNITLGISSFALHMPRVRLIRLVCGCWSVSPSQLLRVNYAGAAQQRDAAWAGPVGQLVQFAIRVLMGAQHDK